MASDGVIAVDTETYPNWTCAVFLDSAGEVVLGVRLREGESISKEDRSKMLHLMRNRAIVSFNGMWFDNYALGGIINGCTPAEIHAWSQAVIVGKKAPWEASKDLGFRDEKPTRHCDIKDLIKGKCSLKELACRIGFPKLETLPFDPTKPVTDEQADTLYYYCVNDCMVTIALYHHIKDEIRLRKHIRDENLFGIKEKLGWRADTLISQSGPKLADLAFGTKSRKGEANPPESVAYSFPADILNRLPQGEFAITHLLATSLTGEYEVNRATGTKGYGNVTADTFAPTLDRMYEALGQRVIRMGACDLTYGVGGLHSQDIPGKWSGRLIQADVASYYPHLMKHAAELLDLPETPFVTKLGQALDKRLKAKADGNKAVSEALKLICNSAYGKTGSVWSPLYDPRLRLSVCLSGQILLTALIEWLSQCSGVTVVSANTDGVLFKLDDDADNSWESACDKWMALTGLTLEYDKIRSRWSESVNSYFEQREDGTIYGKGTFNCQAVDNYSPLSHAPSNDIVAIAAINHCLGRESMSSAQESRLDEPTLWLKASKDTKGVGFELDGEPVGKMVRYYQSEDGGTIVVRNKNGSTREVAHGVRLLNDIDGPIPDLDREIYDQMARDLIVEVQQSA